LFACIDEYFFGMRKFPEKITIGEKDCSFEKILKDDFFSVNVLYRNTEGVRYVLKLSDFRFVGGFLFRPFASLMSKREYRMYQRVADIKGVPELGPRFGSRGYFHRFVEGKTLFECDDGTWIPDDFFDKLKEMLSELHRRRIFYADFNKRGNIIKGDDGNPYLIDFQISLYFKKRGGPVGRLCDRVFASLAKEDLYHFVKHKHRFKTQLVTEEENAMGRRSGFNIFFEGFFGRPYRKVKRLVYPAGSNEVIWYKWNKKNKKQMP
jgi:hypothetical protein